MIKNNQIDTALILISDITKGMKSLGSKCLLNIDNKNNILDIQIQYLKKYYNPKNIILSTGFDHDKVVASISKYKFNIEYAYNKNYDTENQTGALLSCITNWRPKNLLVITNGLLLFNKIKIHTNRSSTYFIPKHQDKNQSFTIGCADVNSSNYLFYNLDHKWIEIMFLDNRTINLLSNIDNTKRFSNMFLFEFINYINNPVQIVDFIQYSDTINPLKINALKDLEYAKKQYKKNTFVSSK